MKTYQSISTPLIETPETEKKPWYQGVVFKGFFVLLLVAVALLAFTRGVDHVQGTSYVSAGAKQDCVANGNSCESSDQCCDVISNAICRPLWEGKKKQTSPVCTDCYENGEVCDSSYRCCDDNASCKVNWRTGISTCKVRTEELEGEVIPLQGDDCVPNGDSCESSDQCCDTISNAICRPLWEGKAKQTTPVCTDCYENGEVCDSSYRCCDRNAACKVNWKTGLSTCKVRRDEELVERLEERLIPMQDCVQNGDACESSDQCCDTVSNAICRPLWVGKKKQTAPVCTDCYENGEECDSSYRCCDSNAACKWNNANQKNVCMRRRAEELVERLEGQVIPMQDDCVRNGDSCESSDQCCDVISNAICRPLWEGKAKQTSPVCTDCYENGEVCDSSYRCCDNNAACKVNWKTGVSTCKVRRDEELVERLEEVIELVRDEQN